MRSRRSERIRQLRRLLKARRAVRARRRLERAQLLLRLLRGDASAAFAEQLAWLRGNWPRVARKFGTDLVAMGARDGLDNLGTTAARRAAKELLNARVMDFYGKGEHEERTLLRHCYAAAIRGDDARARRFLQVYLTLNVRRRLTVNALYYAAVRGGQVELPTRARTLQQIGIATAAEVMQDAVLGVPFLDKPVVRDTVESVRKHLVKEVEGLVLA